MTIKKKKKKKKKKKEKKRKKKKRSKRKKKREITQTIENNYLLYIFPFQESKQKIWIIWISQFLL
jgi:hypothetical protein